MNATVYAGMVRIADSGAENLVAKIQNVIASKGLQNRLRVTDVWRSRDMDIVKNHLYGWRCKYGIKNSSSPDGDITFWANEDGYIQGLRIIYNKPDASDKNCSFRLTQEIIFSIVTGDDISKVKFYRGENGHFNGFYVSPKNNKHYCLTIYPRMRTDGSNINDWGANLFANTSIDEAISFSQEVFFNESYDNGVWTQ